MFLYRVLLLISLISLLGAIQESTHCSALRKKDEECGSYCYKIVKPLLSYAASVRSKEEQFSELTAKIQSLEATIRSLETQLETTKSIQEFKNELLSSNQDIVDKLQNIIDTKNSNANALNTEIKEKDSEIIKLKLQNSASSNKIKELTDKISEMERETKESLPSNCVGKLTAIYEIKVPGSKPFSVPCDSSLADSGWTVIQRRQDGSENFNRTMSDYRSGFG
ncbi:angiopoietin-related protein 3-like [Drosophila hydei]|uniref:Angiopoietin-related protein 3-like n=1 Tax=Drosophila hydei TaxID=7224 RepID=A0A6J2SSJ3_DROHY|nr:angiopoietin-related protein 3-like [Drosophila hydei]